MQTANSSQSPQFKFLPTEKTKPELGFNGKLIVLYGSAGTGKTTATINVGALNNDTQKGTKAHEAYVVPIKKWQDLVDVQKELLTVKNNFSVVSIDLFNDACKMLEQHICDEHKVTHLNDLAYGKGSSLFKDALYRFIMTYVKSDRTVIIIAHEKEKTQKTKVSEVTVMQSSLPVHAQELIFGLADFIFYCYISSDGQRLMRTKPHRNIIAKDRFGILPEVMPLDLIKVKQALESQTKGETK